eukprot:gene1764-3414_t
MKFPNLCSSTFGTTIVFATDEWFASADNLLDDKPAEWREDVYTSYGKWMDGWESRRRRTEGHDWCIIKLGLHGSIKEIDVDTSHFTGNFSPCVSIQAAYFDDDPEAMSSLISLRRQSSTMNPEGRMGTSASNEEFDLANSLQSHKWKIILPLTPLRAGYPDTCHNIFNIQQLLQSSELHQLQQQLQQVSHIRLNMGPDGGIARLRLYGSVSVNLAGIGPDAVLDLAAVEMGGMALGCSNQHYGN